MKRGQSIISAPFFIRSQMENQEKIIKILALLSTGQREDSIRNYIEYIVSNFEGINSSFDIINKTHEEFGLMLQSLEVEDEVEWLVNNGRLVRVSGALQSSELAKQESDAAIEAHNKQALEQYDIFKKEIQNLNKGKVADSQLLILYTAFTEYLYDAFLEYGKTAAAMFTTSVEEGGIGNNNIFLLRALAKVEQQDSKALLESYVRAFSAIINVKQLKYLEQLADKTEAFFALGLSRELYQELQTITPLDWVLFLDTNVLYSVLNIRSNAENEAVKTILQIAKAYPEVFPIKFKYLPITHRELNLMRSRLEDNVPAISLNKKQIMAALASEKLDDFAKTYYQSMLEHGDSALHPSKILNKSRTLLDAKGVGYYNRELFNEDEESAEFQEKISSYNQYQQIRNEARMEMGMEPRMGKSIDKVAHDVTLREMILLLRQSEEYQTPVHIADCKAYGLTLDKGLLEYDRTQLKKLLRSSEFIPTFFLPSYLLKRMFRYLPVQSDDYRKSFISAISSPVVISKDKDSKMAQAAIKHLKAMGIDEPELIITALTSDIFLSNIQRLEGDDEKIEEFIESEINKSIKEKNEALEERKIKIEKIEEKLKKTGSFSQQVLEQNKALEVSKSTLEGDVKVLTAGLDRLSKQLKKDRKLSRVDSPQVQLAIAYPDEKDVLIKDLKQQVDALSALEKSKAAALQSAKEKRMREYKAEEVKKWQRAPWMFFWVLIFIAVASTIVFLYVINWDVKNIFSEANNKPLKTVFSALIGIIAYIFSAYLGKEIQTRNSDFKNINEFRTQIIVPDGI